MKCYSLGLFLISKVNTMRNIPLIKFLFLLFWFSLSFLVSCSNVHLSSSSGAPKPTGSLWEGNTVTVWNQLQAIPPSRLENLLSHSQDPNQAAWLKLAILSKK